MAFNQQDAAAALGVSVDHFERHISNEELQRHAEALAPLLDRAATGQKRHEHADGCLTARKRIYGRNRRASA